jgi:hypothetical protein
MIKGAIPNEQAVLLGMQPAFKKCYDDALKKDPKAAGSTSVVAKVGIDGEVTSASPAQTDGLADDLVTCLVGVVRSSKFDPPVGGSGKVIVPVNLGR